MYTIECVGVWFVREGKHIIFGFRLSHFHSNNGNLRSNYATSCCPQSNFPGKSRWASNEWPLGIVPRRRGDSLIWDYQNKWELLRLHSHQGDTRFIWQRTPVLRWTEIRACIKESHTHCLRDDITNPWPKINGGLIESPLRLGHGRVITSGYLRSENSYPWPSLDAGLANPCWWMRPMNIS